MTLTRINDYIRDLQTLFSMHEQFAQQLSNARTMQTLAERLHNADMLTKVKKDVQQASEALAHAETMLLEKVRRPDVDGALRFFKELTAKAEMMQKAVSDSLHNKAAHELTAALGAYASDAERAQAEQVVSDDARDSQKVIDAVGEMLPSAGIILSATGGLTL